MIADAGGLGAWPQRDGTAILTPHPGEMARLTGLPRAKCSATASAWRAAMPCSTA